MKLCEDLVEIDKQVEFTPGVKAAIQLGDEWFWPVGAKETCARIRRGKYVMIPREWRGKVPHPPTIRKRPSKMTSKARRRAKRRVPEASKAKGAPIRL